MIGFRNFLVASFLGIVVGSASAANLQLILVEKSSGKGSLPQALQENFALRTVKEKEPEAKIPLDAALAILGDSMKLPVLVVATPQGEPVMAQNFRNGPELMRTLEEVRTLWNTSPEQIQAAANEVREALKGTLLVAKGEAEPVFIKAEMSRKGQGFTAVLKVEIEDGYHTNSDRPFQEWLIPTTVKGEGLTVLKIDFPHAEEMELEFSDEPLSLFEGRFEVRVTGTLLGDNPVLTYGFQACSEDTCLPPNRVKLQFQTAP